MPDPGCYCVHCLRYIPGVEMDGFLADGMCVKCRELGRPGVNCNEEETREEGPGKEEETPGV